MRRVRRVTTRTTEPGATHEKKETHSHAIRSGSSEFRTVEILAHVERNVIEN